VNKYTTLDLLTCPLGYGGQVFFLKGEQHHEYELIQETTIHWDQKEKSNEINQQKERST
jgi:hypothetical protein